MTDNPQPILGYTASAQAARDLAGLWLHHERPALAASLIQARAEEVAALLHTLADDPEAAARVRTVLMVTLAEAASRS